MSASDCRQAVPGHVRPGAGSSEGQDPPLCSGSSGEHCEGAGGRREADETGTRWFRPSGGLRITAKGKASTHTCKQTQRYHYFREKFVIVISGGLKAHVMAYQTEESKELDEQKATH